MFSNELLTGLAVVAVALITATLLLASRRKVASPAPDPTSGSVPWICRRNRHKGNGERSYPTVAFLHLPTAAHAMTKKDVCRAQAQARADLRRLDRSLAKEYLDGAKAIWQLPPQPGQAEALTRSLELVARARTLIQVLYTNVPESDSQLARPQARGLANEIIAILAAEPPDHHVARRLLARTVDLLNAADAALVVDEPNSVAGKHLVVPSELLYQAHHALFPAERMLVLGGRTERETIRLGAAFEVTGANGMGHVKADPDRLAQALIAMDRADCFLGAWFHSHPGRGAASTHPSSTDLTQHQDWIADYTPRLVSAILVEDGWIRFFGTALERHEVQIAVTGSGVSTMEDDGYLYRLVAG